MLLRLYAPLPESTLRQLARMVGGRGLDDAGRERALARFVADAAVASGTVDRVRYLWPADEDPREAGIDERVRALAPFDPVVWDRRRFEHLWGWAYRFEAYTPVARRVRGYYALPLLWRDRVIGWGNLALRDGVLQAEFGHVDPRLAREQPFKAALADELDRMRAFLGADR